MDAADCRCGSGVQVSLVMDTQSNGAQLNAEDVFVNTAPYVPGKRVVANASRFKVLKTQMFWMQDPATGTDGANTQTLGGMVRTFRWFVKQNQVVNFVTGAGAGTVADCKDVSYHIIACTTEQPAASADQLTYSSRVRFVG